MRSAVATAPIDTSVEVLTERLLTLRAEIDAILEQLARQRAAAGEETAALADPPETIAEPAFAEVHNSITERADFDAAAAEPASADQPSPASLTDIEIVHEHAEMAVADASTTCAAPAVVEPVEVVAPAVEAASLEEVLGHDAMAPVAVTEPVPTLETAIMSELSETPLQAEPAATTPTVPAIEPPAETAVISLDAHRQTSRTVAEAAKAVAEHQNRRYRVKIAACILASLAVASLAFADLSALGSAPSSALAAPSTAPWSYQRLWQGLQRGRAASDLTGTQSGLLMIEGFPVSANRYREAWPSGS